MVANRVNSNTKLALALIAVFLGMVFLTAASVPIYKVFCRVTGYGGTTKVALSSSQSKGSKELIVKFDANIDDKLPWIFTTKQTQIKVTTGENAIAFYYVENKSDKVIIGTAVYNVTPHQAAKYFNKIECFCFQEQLLKSGQKALMPVTFFIDPEIEKDPELQELKELTLSYSFYKVMEK